MENLERVDGRNERAKTVGSVSVRLTHPLLPGNLLVRRYHGRQHWEVMHVVGRDGRCEDGLSALLSADLEIESFRAETPRLVGRND